MPVVRQRLRLGLVFLASVTITLGGTSCEQSVADRRPLRIATSPWPGFDIAHYGEAEKLFASRGVAVEFIRLEHQSDAVRAISRGRADAAFASISDIVSMPAESDPVAILLVTNVSAGSDGIVVRAGIDSLDQLRGQRVAAKIGSVNQLILYEALDWKGVPTGAVDIVDVTNEVGYRKFLDGEVDAAVLWEPQLSEAAGRSGGRVLFRTSDIESSVIDALIAPQESVAAHRAAFAQFTAGWLDVMHAVETRPEVVYRTVASRLGQSAGSFARDYAGLRRGDRDLNRRLIQERELNLRLPKIRSLLDRTPESSPTILIEAESMGRVIQNWTPRQ
ncbi:MAG: ABC transporter substrate-binding protein [Planctomycetota bacterium]